VGTGFLIFNGQIEVDAGQRTPAGPVRRLNAERSSAEN